MTAALKQTSMKRSDFEHLCLARGHQYEINQEKEVVGWPIEDQWPYIFNPVLLTPNLLIEGHPSVLERVNNRASIGDGPCSWRFWFSVPYLLDMGNEFAARLGTSRGGMIFRWMCCSFFVHLGIGGVVEFHFYCRFNWRFWSWIPRSRFHRAECIQQHLFISRASEEQPFHILPLIGDSSCSCSWAPLEAHRSRIFLSLQFNVEHKLSKTYVLATKFSH